MGQRDHSSNGMTTLWSTNVIERSLAVTHGFMLTPTPGVTKVGPRAPDTGLPHSLTRERTEATSPVPANVIEPSSCRP
jgi:hypothetical protein